MKIKTDSAAAIISLSQLLTKRELQLFRRPQPEWPNDHMLAELMGLVMRSFYTAAVV